ncbi:MAG: hypothetical protein E7316_08480 [Clostridiales bacterium]|nr:hypothetical protein [Clostridiales bacterium]
MKLLLVLILLLPLPACGESLTESIAQVVDGLDVAALESVLQQEDPLAATGGFSATVAAIARGELTLSFDQVMSLVSNQFFAAAKASLWRLTRLMAPTLLWSLLRRLTGKDSDAGKTVCYLIVCVFLTQDLTEHTALCTASMEKISSGMQGLFPLLLTLMAAVGGSAGSTLMQPAVVAAAGSMTAFIRHVTLPLATMTAVITMLCHLGEGIRLTRLADLFHQAATWTLGLCFTAFIGVLATRGVTAAAVDGVTIRTAKYAMDNLIPVVGGLFADTVDTLVGSSMLVQSALGVTGLILIVAWAMAPLCQTLAAALLYKLAAALMQPVADGWLARCIHDFSRVLMLLFIIQLCTAAMFLLLIAQLIAVSGMTMMLR